MKIGLKPVSWPVCSDKKLLSSDIDTQWFINNYAIVTNMHFSTALVKFSGLIILGKK